MRLKRKGGGGGLREKRGRDGIERNRGEFGRVK